MLRKTQYFDYIKNYPEKFTNSEGAGIEIVTDETKIMEIESAL